MKANHTRINRNNINDILKLKNQEISETSVTFSKIFKKLKLEFSKYFHIVIIGTTDNIHQIIPTINLFLESSTQSMYEKIYPQITIGISETIESQIMVNIVSIIFVLNYFYFPF
jgi:hypothetical protein